METNGNKISDGLGNTISKPRIVPGLYWCFTLNNWTIEEYNSLKETLETKKCLYIIGKEIGEEKTPHLQGYIESPKKIRPIETFNNKRIHWEKRRGTREDNIKYCSKEGDFITNFKIPKKVIDPLKDRELYAWQKNIIKIIESPVDDRLIYWYWEPDGCQGKTSLAKHLCLNHNCIMLSGKANDIKAGIVSHLEKKKEIDIAIFHFTRTVEEYISYEAIEAVKDGIFFSGKYESSMVIFNSPHIIIFANFPPDLSKMSADRWVVCQINDVVDLSPPPVPGVGGRRDE